MQNIFESLLLSLELASAVFLAPGDPSHSNDLYLLNPHALLVYQILHSRTSCMPAALLAVHNRHLCSHWIHLLDQLASHMEENCDSRELIQLNSISVHIRPGSHRRGHLLVLHKPQGLQGRESGALLHLALHFGCRVFLLYHRGHYTTQIRCQLETNFYEEPIFCAECAVPHQEA